MADENNITKLLTALLTSTQDLEDALLQLKTERYIDTAVGAQLDQIGAKVGQPRNGLSDDDYRRYCRARIAANRSHGRAMDVLKVSRLVVNDAGSYLHYENQGHATFVLRVEDVITTTAVRDALIEFLRDATKTAGVRAIVESSTMAPSTWFRWDTGPGWDTGTLIDAVD